MNRHHLIYGAAWGTLAVAVLQLAAAIGTGNVEQAVAAGTAIIAAIMPAVVDWLRPKPPTPPTPHA